MPGLNRVLASFNRFWFEPVDSRLYAAVRVGFALTALLNLSVLWPHRHQLLSASGMFDAPDSVTGSLAWSVFDLVSSELGVTIVMLTAAASMVCLGLGVRTSVAALLVYGWHVSYTNRALPATSDMDTLLRVTAFLVAISPCGRSWSLDAHRRREPGQLAPRYGLLLMQWQLAVMYWTTGFRKVVDPYWQDGEIVGYFWLSSFSTLPPEVVGYARLAAVATYATLALEFSLPFLLWSRSTRFIAIVAGVGFHLSIALTSTVDVFSFAALALYLAFLDQRDIRRLVSATAAIRERIGKRPTPAGP